jgi:hypothetical protein
MSLPEMHIQHIPAYNRRRTTRSAILIAGLSFFILTTICLSCMTVAMIAACQGARIGKTEQYAIRGIRTVINLPDLSRICRSEWR